MGGAGPAGPGDNAAEGGSESATGGSATDDPDGAALGGSKGLALDLEIGCEGTRHPVLIEHGQCIRIEGQFKQGAAQTEECQMPDSCVYLPGGRSTEITNSWGVPIVRWVHAQPECGHSWTVGPCD
jgi:hypothetical protein